MNKILISILVLIFIMPVGFSDTNGVWIDAKDVRSGTFGTDENSGNYVFPNNLSIMGDEGSLKMIGDSHNYIEFYPQGESSGRKGWFGYGESGSSDLTMQVDGSSNVLLNPNWGYVGIGTDSPNSELDVDGVINANNLFSNGEEVATNDYVNNEVSDTRDYVDSEISDTRDWVNNQDYVSRSYFESEISRLENQINNAQPSTKNVEVITEANVECVHGDPADPISGCMASAVASTDSQVITVLE